MKSMKARKLIWIGIGMGILFWFVEAGVHTFVFKEGSYVLQLMNLDRHEMWMRLVVVVLFVIFGFYSWFVVDKRIQAENKAKLAYEEINQIFRTAADGMRIIDRDFTVSTVNDTFCALARVDKKEAEGKKCYEVFRGPMCHTMECPMIAILAGREMIECYVEKERKDGIKVPCILAATPFRDLDGRIIGIVEDFKDISEYKRVEKKLDELNRKLLISNKKLKQLTLKDPHTGLYNHRYLRVVIESEFNRAKRSASPLSVMMMDVDYFKAINDVYGHRFGDTVLKQLAKLLKRQVRRYDSVVRFGGEEFVIVCPGVDKSATVNMARRILDVAGKYNFGYGKHVIKMKLSIAVASFFEDKVKNGMGLVDLADIVLRKIKEDGGNRVYSCSDVGKEMFPEKNSDNTDADNVRHVKNKIDKLVKRANQSLVEAVFAFAKTVKFKEYYDQEHIENTVRHATKIAKSLFLPQAEVEHIRQAAMLYDLGKIGISEQILLKKGRLTEEEYSKVRQHPQIGAEIIKPVQSFRETIPMILYHHEKWNGQGSFYGLKGEEIPLGARIIALADVYGALISDRPYRKAFSKEEAVDFIKSKASTEFDPRIVETFLKVLSGTG